VNRETELRDLDRRIAILDHRIEGRTLEAMTNRERRQLHDVRAALLVARGHIATRLAQVPPGF
jgi:hypothetical protein